MSAPYLQRFPNRLTDAPETSAAHPSDEDRAGGRGVRCELDHLTEVNSHQGLHTSDVGQRTHVRGAQNSKPILSGSRNDKHVSLPASNSQRAEIGRHDRVAPSSAGHRGAGPAQQSAARGRHRLLAAGGEEGSGLPQPGHRLTPAVDQRSLDGQPVRVLLAKTKMRISDSWWTFCQKRCRCLLSLNCRRRGRRWARSPTAESRPWRLRVRSRRQVRRR
jgi:hypothetical protein